MKTGTVTVKIDDEKIKERMRDMLAAAWDEGHLAGTSDMTSVIGWGVDDMQGKPPEKSLNPYRDTP